MDTFIVYLVWLGVYCAVIGTAEMIAEIVIAKKKAHRRQPVSANKKYTNLIVNHERG